MKVRNLSSGSLHLELQAVALLLITIAESRVMELKKQGSLKNGDFFYTWSLWGLLSHKGHKYCNGQSSDSLFYFYSTVTL